jgi:hypothetical protein
MKWYFNPTGRSAESCTESQEFCDELDCKRDAADCHHAHEHKAQMLGIILSAGFPRQPERLDNFRYLALHYGQFKNELPYALYKISDACYLLIEET